MWRVAEAEAQARPTSSISQCVIFFFLRNEIWYFRIMLLPVFHRYVIA